MHPVHRFLLRFRSVVVDILNGYEPVIVRSFLAALFIALAAFGIGSGELPAQVEAVLAFAAFAAPLVGGWFARRKVTPVGKDDLLPDNPYGDGPYTAS